MHRFLHLLFVSLLVVLLPLRGWAGDVMAIEMTTKMAANSAATPANNVLNQQEAIPLASQMQMPSDCAMHSQPLAADVAVHCTSCDTCGLCLSVTSLKQVQPPVSRAHQHSSPLALDVSFSSAVKTSDLKPPIS